jgi:hypothetical protein
LNAEELKIRYSVGMNAVLPDQKAHALLFTLMADPPVRPPHQAGLWHGTTAPFTDFG